MKRLGIKTVLFTVALCGGVSGAFSVMNQSRRIDGAQMPKSENSVQPQSLKKLFDVYPGMKFLPASRRELPWVDLFAEEHIDKNQHEKIRETLRRQGLEENQRIFQLLYASEVRERSREKSQKALKNVDPNRIEQIVDFLLERDRQHPDLVEIQARYFLREENRSMTNGEVLLVKDIRKTDFMNIAAEFYQVRKELSPNSTVPLFLERTVMKKYALHYAKLSMELDK